MGGALQHLRVLDATDLRGALAGRLLADLGADVIKLAVAADERDRLRPPFAGQQAGVDRSLPFLYRHANKRGAVVDHRSVEGRARFDRLLAGADVLIENLARGEREHWAVHAEALRERHPHLVHVTISDFGSSGPRAGWRL